MINKSDFADWKANPVTKAVFRQVEADMYQMAIDLAGKAGLDSLEDRYTAGVIRGMQRVTEVDFEDTDDTTS